MAVAPPIGAGCRNFDGLLQLKQASSGELPTRELSPREGRCLHQPVKSGIVSVSVIARTKIGPMYRCRGTGPTRAARVSGPQTTAWRPSVNRQLMSGGGGHTIPSRVKPSARLFVGLSPSRRQARSAWRGRDSRTRSTLNDEPRKMQPGERRSLPRAFSVGLVRVGEKP
jgi:hypothetical protein